MALSNHIPSLRLLDAAVAWLALSSTLAQAALTGNVRTHDPSRIVKEGNRYYLFATGANIASKYSDNLVHWTSGPNVFAAPPAWTTSAVPGFTNNFWAPDVMKVGDEYRLYYSVSTFGSQVSAIGLATNATLDPASPQYQWVDQGPVIQSQVGSPYNTIDPSVYEDHAGRMWLTFGSFWNGIDVTELDPLTGKRITPNSFTTRIAHKSRRPTSKSTTTSTTCSSIGEPAARARTARTTFDTVAAPVPPARSSTRTE
jgi:arabinan endo-1,5-alpha-L-arabinosidase